MTTKELIEFLQQQEGKDILLKLQGIITTNILIGQMKINYEKNFLFLENKENKEERVADIRTELLKINNKEGFGTKKSVP